MERSARPLRVTPTVKTVATPTVKTAATPTAKTAATPTARTPDGHSPPTGIPAASGAPPQLAPTWIDRRQFHPDAPRLDDLRVEPDIWSLACRWSSRSLVDAQWGDAERLWDRFLRGGVRAPGFRLVRLGSTLTRRDFCRSAPIGNEQVDDLVDPNRVLQHYAAGATVVLQALQFSDPVYAELSTNLALELDHPVQVNAYLTPPAEQRSRHPLRLPRRHRRAARRTQALARLAGASPQRTAAQARSVDRPAVTRRTRRRGHRPGARAGRLPRHPTRLSACRRIGR